MKEYILITTTFNNKSEAQKVIDILLEKRLVSCCQINEIESFYHWKGRIQNEKEYLVIMKTKKILYQKVEKEILKYHSYEVPEIVSYDITNGYHRYLDWINNETESI